MEEIYNHVIEGIDNSKCGTLIKKNKATNASGFILDNKIASLNSENAGFIKQKSECLNESVTSILQLYEGETVFHCDKYGLNWWNQYTLTPYPTASAGYGGYIYVALANNTIIKLTENLVLDSTFGSTGVGQLQFNTIIAMDTYGDKLYVSEFGNNRIQIINTADDSYNSVIAINNPRGIYVDANGIFVACYPTAGYPNDPTIRVYDLTTHALTTSWGGTVGSGDGEFNLLDQISGYNNEIYTVETINNYRIQVFNTAGVFQRKFNTPYFGTSTAGSITFNANGDLVLGDITNYLMKRIIKTDGSLIASFMTPGTGYRQTIYPYGVDYYNGNLYSLEFYPIRIVKTRAY